jgi:hypothetical protein
MVDGDCIDDADPCTDQVCIGGTCEYPFNAAPCDDGQVCTENDVCSKGACEGSLVTCDDDNPCTDDSCEPEVGCVAVPNAVPCDDADPCTEFDVCSEGSCLGTDLDCNDDDSCTIDRCDRGDCRHSEKIDCCDEDSDCGPGFECILDACSPLPGGSTNGGPGDSGLDGSGDAEGGMVTSAGQETGTDTETGPGQVQSDASGCTCTTTPSQERPWWLVLPLGLWLRRRRAA